MKKLLTALFIIISSFAFAQKGLHLGASGNLNTVWIVNQNAYGGEEYDYTLKTGAGAGLNVGYNLTDHIGVFTGFKFSNQGQSYESSKNTGETRDISLRYNYIPLLVRFTGGSSSVKFYAQAGPQFGFISNATYEYDGPTIDPIKGDIKDRFNSGDNGVNFGIGANIDITSKIYINAGLDLFYSFNDINEEKFHIPDSSGVYEPSKNATGGLNIGVHYILFGKE